MIKPKEKTKFYYDPQTLSYKAVKIPLWHSIRRFLIWFFSVGSVWIVVYFMVYNFILTPRELYLTRELENMALNYELLDKQLAKNAEILATIENRDDNIYRVIFESDPYPKEKREAGIGGVNRYKNLEGYKFSDIIIESSQKVDELTRRLYAQSKSFDEVAALAKRKEEMLRSIPAIQPVSLTQAHMISSYGYRIHPISKVVRLHKGMDFSAKIGTPVYATGDGKVVYSGGDGGSGYGYHVVIDHGFGYKTMYAHLSRLNVTEGKKIIRGEIIGAVGNTGRSTGPHLHYEVFRNGSNVNPINYYYKDITVEQYNELLERASEHTSPLD